MTLRQQILKRLYPLFVFYKRISGKSKKLEGKKVTPAVSFYDLSVTLNNGNNFQFEELKGRKILIVNTASNCGYTHQYTELQELYRSHSDKLTIIGFPSNDFREQENGSDEEIARFCQVNYGVSFPLAKKSVVLGKEGQNKVFEWLTSKQFNGWNEQEPSWNFSKYLVDEQGLLTHYFDPAVSPLSIEVLQAINE